VADIFKAAVKCRYKDRHYFNVNVDAKVLDVENYVGKYYVRVKNEIEELSKLSNNIYRIDSDFVYFTNEIELKILHNILSDNEYSLLKIN